VAKKILYPFLLLFCLTCNHSVPQKGLLVIIGGRKKPAEAVRSFIDHCNGGKILVIPSASAVPLESGPEAAQLFRDHGANNVDWIFILDKEMASADSVVQMIRESQGIFFTGGVQTRLMDRIGGTPAEDAIHELYFKRGGVVGGTSAGAAVMSQIMITGDGDFNILERDNIVTEKGLGLVNHCIIDQHFIRRSRNNRLLSLVIEKNMIGVGIDESTAVLYYPNDTFRVVGQGSVLIYDPRGSHTQNISGKGKLAIGSLKLSVLYHGLWFDLNKGRIVHE